MKTPKKYRFVKRSYYYDGTDCYLNGATVSEIDIYPYHYLSGNILGDLIGCENLFNSTTQGSKIIYSAESITLYDVILCKDVELTVDNGKLIQLTYNKDNAVLDNDTGTIYAGTFTITFSNYGTTVVNG